MPLSGRASATKRHVLARDSIEILAELLTVDRWRRSEDLGHRLRGHEPEPSQRCERTDRHTTTGDDKGLAFVEATHDLAAAIAKFSLCDGLPHLASVAPGATTIGGVSDWTRSMVPGVGAR